LTTSDEQRYGTNRTYTGGVQTMKTLNLVTGALVVVGALDWDLVRPHRNGVAL
jgi:hypothetical protein